MYNLFTSVTLPEVSAYLIQTHEIMEGLKSCPNPIIRAVAVENSAKIETVMQWLDTRAGVCPVSAIFAVLGKLAIFEKFDDEKGEFISQVFPPLSE